jgi:cytolysin (calcineurin-like family phosphatase)
VSPAGVIVVGDLTEDRSLNQVGAGWRSPEFKTYTGLFEHESGQVEGIRFPVYVGLGNHDLAHFAEDSGQPGLVFSEDEARQRIWDYVWDRHRGFPEVGLEPPVPVANFDDQSYAYSWDWGNLHLVQLHTFGGDDAYHPSSLDWLAADLDAVGPDRPVILFQHYGWDCFSDGSCSDPAWWTLEQMVAFNEAVDGHNIIGAFHGHTHGGYPGLPRFYTDPFLQLAVPRQRDVQIFNLADAGQGYFAVVRVTTEAMDVLYGVVDEAGTVTFSPENGFTLRLNQAPTADAGGPYRVEAGGLVSIEGSGSDPECGPVTFAWDFGGDGTVESTEQNPNFRVMSQLDAPARQDVLLWVCDQAGLCSDAWTAVDITVGRPAASASNGGSFFTRLLGAAPLTRDSLVR